MLVITASRAACRLSRAGAPAIHGIRGNAITRPKIPPHWLCGPRRLLTWMSIGYHFLSCRTFLGRHPGPVSEVLYRIDREHSPATR